MGLREHGELMSEIARRGQVLSCWFLLLREAFGELSHAAGIPEEIVSSLARGAAKRQPEVSPTLVSANALSSNNCCEVLRTTTHRIHTYAVCCERLVKLRRSELPTLPTCECEMMYALGLRTERI